MILVTNNEGTPGAPVTAQQLDDGRPGLDAIEAGIRLVESDETIRTVGRGGWPNLLGEVELDAAMMHGGSLRTGAVGGIKGYLHPVSVARQVLEQLPHEILIGEGAARFAHEIGAEAGDNLIEDSAKVWRRWFETEVPAADRAAWPDVPLSSLCRHAIDPEIGRDTTVFLAQDSSGEIMAGTSTSGWGWKYPGRLGDTPIVGAGFYADSRYGAAACTGTGEMAIRAGTSRAIVAYLKMGLSLDAALQEAAADMDALTGGLINRVTIHAIDNKGNHKVIAVNGNPSNTYWFWQPGMAAPEARSAEIVALSTPMGGKDPASPAAISPANSDPTSPSPTSPSPGRA